jgi:hypothetical protein
LRCGELGAVLLVDIAVRAGHIAAVADFQVHDFAGFVE